MPEAATTGAEVMMPVPVERGAVTALLELVLEVGFVALFAEKEAVPLGGMGTRLVLIEMAAAELVEMAKVEDGVGEMELELVRADDEVATEDLEVTAEEEAAADEEVTADEEATEDLEVTADDEATAEDVVMLEVADEETTTLELVMSFW